MIKCLPILRNIIKKNPLRKDCGNKIKDDDGNGGERMLGLSWWTYMFLTYLNNDMKFNKFKKIYIYII